MGQLCKRKHTALAAPGPPFRSVPQFRKDHRSRRVSATRAVAQAVVSGWSVVPDPAFFGVQRVW